MPLCSALTSHLFVMHGTVNERKRNCGKMNTKFRNGQISIVIIIIVVAVVVSVVVGWLAFGILLL